MKELHWVKVELCGGPLDGHQHYYGIYFSPEEIEQQNNEPQMIAPSCMEYLATKKDEDYEMVHRYSIDTQIGHCVYYRYDDTVTNTFGRD